MGTVRREGDWRLEKRGEGVYEITFRKEPQMKVYTSDAPRNGGQQSLFHATPVQEVSSYNDAEGLFEEKAHGPPPLGMEYSSAQTTTGSSYSTQDDFGEDIDLEDVPPGLFGVALLLAGSLILYTSWGDGNEIALYMGVGLAGIGILILAYAAFLFKTQGWREAWDFFVTVDEDSRGSSSSSATASTPEKTPPAPQSLKNELFFERAERYCEYCDDPIDHPEVHHINPRSEGGKNDPKNLIVLCPNCHRKADSGSISKSRLRYKVRKQSGTA